MTNWITVPYKTTGIASLAEYEAFMNERPMKIDDDSKPLARAKVGKLHMAALEAMSEITKDMRAGIGFRDPRTSRGMKIAFTAARDIRAEGVTRAQNEMIKPIAEMMHFHAAVGSIEDPIEAYKFAVTTIIDVLASIGLTND